MIRKLLERRGRVCVCVCVCVRRGGGGVGAQAMQSRHAQAIATLHGVRLLASRFRGIKQKEIHL